MLSAIFKCKQCEKWACKKSRTIVLVKQNNNQLGKQREPKFEVGDASGGDGAGERHKAELPVDKTTYNSKELHGQVAFRQGIRDAGKEERFAKVVEKEKQHPVIMAAAAKVAKRIPLIKFPNRKAGQAQGAVSRASGGAGQSQGSHAVPTLPSGTASSQPHRTKLSEAEIEAILLGGAPP